MANFWQKMFKNGNIAFSLQNGNFLAISVSSFFHTFTSFKFDN